MDGHNRMSPELITVCVTGGTGYIGSWLIRMLLQKGYVVHATVRDIGKASWLLSSLSGYGELKIFKADLNVDGSFDDAVKDCQFVFHVAASMEFSTSVQQNIEDYVREKILEPAIRGTKNVLQSCLKAGSVKKVIFTSSISTITAEDDEGCRRSLINESCIVPIDRVWRTKPKGWVYVLAKLLTEEIAFQFAKDIGIGLVSIIPPTIAGPFLTLHVPSSLRVLLSPITGDPELYPILLAVHSRLGSVPLVHIEDICEAHIFLMKQSAAEGRYICSTSSCHMTELTDLLYQNFPNFSYDKVTQNNFNSLSPEISSKRLTDLGFKFRYGVNDIVQQTVKSCIGCGFLAEQCKNVITS